MLPGALLGGGCLVGEFSKAAPTAGFQSADVAVAVALPAFLEIS